MKKILIILFISFFTFSGYAYSASNNCEYDVDTNKSINIGEALNNCLQGSKLVNGDNVSLSAEGGFAKQIKLWTNNIAIYLGIFAVGSIVFGGLMMTLSAGEEEKIKKAKDIVKWGIIGFIGLISVSAIINLVVKIMYSI